MRNMHWLVMALVALALAGGVLGWSQWARAAEPQGVILPTAATTTAAPASVAPEGNPVVAVIPGRTDTDYEQDPFETHRLRRSSTRVRTLIYVYQDGTMEQKDVR